MERTEVHIFSGDEQLKRREDLTLAERTQLVWEFGEIPEVVGFRFYQLREGLCTCGQAPRHKVGCRIFRVVRHPQQVILRPLRPGAGRGGGGGMCVSAHVVVPV
ncbi:MAG: hypothetical protein V1716_02185 [Candidatus Uhrbacteria bacterium]